MMTDFVERSLSLSRRANMVDVETLVSVYVDFVDIYDEGDELIEYKLVDDDGVRRFLIFSGG